MEKFTPEQRESIKLYSLIDTNFGFTPNVFQINDTYIIANGNRPMFAIQFIRYPEGLDVCSKDISKFDERIVPFLADYKLRYNIQIDTYKNCTYILDTKNLYPFVCIQKDTITYIETNTKALETLKKIFSLRWNNKLTMFKLIKHLGENGTFSLSEEAEYLTDVRSPYDMDEITFTYDTPGRRRVDTYKFAKNNCLFLKTTVINITYEEPQE